MNKSMKFVLGGLALLCSSQDVLGKYDLTSDKGFEAAIQHMTTVNNPIKYTKASKEIIGRGSNVKQNLIGNAFSKAVDDKIKVSSGKLADVETELKDATSKTEMLKKYIENVKADFLPTIKKIETFLSAIDQKPCSGANKKRINAQLTNVRALKNLVATEEKLKPLR